MKRVTMERNNPLTLEQLREMDGWPVWVIPIDSPHQRPGWMQVMSEFNIVARHQSIAKSVYARFGGYGNEWIAYRRKPEMSVLTAPFPSPVWAEHFHARFERTE